VGGFASVGHFTFMAPIPAWDPFASVALYSAFHYHVGPFHLREPPPGRGGGFGVVCAGSRLDWNFSLKTKIMVFKENGF